MKKFNSNELDIIVPISTALNHPTAKDVINTALYFHKNYGFCRFALASPGAAWRGKCYPPKEVFIKNAEMFLQIKKELEPLGIDCGWWLNATLKSGPSPHFIRQVKENGETHPFSNCPSDPAFIKTFCDNAATFATIAKPSFIITEDDFSIVAANGCFCKYHLKAFEDLCGKYYSREEIVKFFDQDTPDAIEITKLWRENLKNSLVNIAKELRKAIDVNNPEIPIGYMQSGGIDFEGGATYEISKAFAGEKHTPFSRLYGTFYCGFKPKRLPEILFHPIYSKQHINEDFVFYHETDTFPHTSHYSSGTQMNALMGIIYSCGFDGSTYQAGGLLDYQFEESAYGKMYARERTRLNTINKLSKKCELSGVELAYDPFFNTFHKGTKNYLPLWASPVGRFGIPYTSLDSHVKFWDVRQAKYYSDDLVLKALSKGLFLDGEAAKALCERGYGKYLGVSVGEDVTEGNTLIYDLGTREIICDEFVQEGKGKNMHSAHMLSTEGNGKMLKLSVTDEKCQIITNYFSGHKDYICPSMTRFENSLGGRVVVMGLTLDKNQSQALYNYRRQRLIQNLISWCSDSFLYVKEAPDVFPVVNVPKNAAECDFRAMLTVVNLCEDMLDEIKIHYPEAFGEIRDIYYIDVNGERIKADFEKTDDAIVIKKNINYLLPEYFVFV